MFQNDLKSKTNQERIRQGKLILSFKTSQEHGSSRLYPQHSIYSTSSDPPPQSQLFVDHISYIPVLFYHCHNA